MILGGIRRRVTLERVWLFLRMSVCGSVFEAERCLAFWKKLWYDKNEEECVEGSVDGVIRIAVVDDEKEVLKFLMQIISDALQKEEAQFEIASFLKAEDLLASHREKPFQIVFADLEMPEVDGLHLAKKLRKKDDNVLLIFVTSHEELVFQCFQYEVFYFVRKEFLKSELPKVAVSAYQKVWDHVSKLQLKSKDRLVSVSADDILYFVSANHKVLMHEKDNVQIQVMYTLEKLEKLLPKGRFIRCHAGYIVNCFYIFSINQNEIVLTTGEQIPLSRHRKKEVKTIFQHYLRSI